MSFASRSCLVAVLLAAGLSQPAAADPLGEIGFTPATPYAFADTTVGTAASAKLTLKNSSPLAVSISSFALTGPDAGAFTLGTSDCPSQLLPSSSCALDVGWKPTHSGAATAQVVVGNDGVTSPLTQELSGVAVAAQLSASPGGLDFGTAIVGHGEQGGSVSFTNAGVANAQLGGASLDGLGAAAFRIGWDGCNMQQLSPGQSCTVQLGFSPQTGGTQLATLHLHAGETDAAVALSGFGGVQQVSPSPSPLDFGDVAVGTSATRVVTLHNTGNLPYQPIVILPTGGDVGAFGVVGDGCSMLPLAPGGDCELTVRFTPLEAGAASARVTVIQGDGEPATITLRGRGRQGAIVLSPHPLDFGGQAIAAATTRELTVTNGGDGPLDVATVAIGGDDADAFRVAGEQCGGVALAAGASCTVRVRFTAQRLGAATATVRVILAGGGAAASGGGSPATGAASAPLLGSGVAAAGTATGAGAATAPPAGSAAAGAAPGAPLTPAGIAFDRRRGAAAPYGPARIRLGRARCAPRADCRVTVRALVLDRAAPGQPAHRVRLAPATWRPGAGRSVSLALPRGVADPLALVAVLRVTAAGHAASTRTIVVGLVPRGRS